MDTIDEIIETRMRLERELEVALSTMERKDTIKQIRKDMITNQNRCPHQSARYGWERKNGTCPYCGRVLDAEANTRNDY